ncbi:MAG: hypothetical protein ABR58_05315 [Acidimicrobium sp. BACL19 MAG-120924-bin39]|nr:MAG: hypothetical protein ABR58_05315 [Acidimicrobium sp. BACL19 MAG-120924-bin39]
MIAVDECPHIDDHEMAVFDHGRGRTMMRPRTVGPRGNDGVVTRAVSTMAAHAVFKFVAHITLGDPGRHHRQTFSECGVSAF